MRKNNSLHTILTAGIVAAILDMSGAIIVYAVLLDITTTQKILQSVAAGLIGQAAREGGWLTALLGMGLHTFIAIGFAAFYYLIRPTWVKIFSNKWIAGIVFGCLVWMIMNWVIVPLAAGRQVDFSKFKFDQFFLYSIGLVIFMVGIPIAAITQKYKSSNIDE